MPLSRKVTIHLIFVGLAIVAASWVPWDLLYKAIVGLIVVLFGLIYGKAVERREIVHHKLWQRLKRENIRHKTRRHWFALTPVAMALFVAVLLYVGSLFASPIHLRAASSGQSSQFPQLSPEIPSLGPTPPKKGQKHHRQASGASPRLPSSITIPLDLVLLIASLATLLVAAWLFVLWWQRIFVVTQSNLVLLRDPPTFLPFMPQSDAPWPVYIFDNVSSSAPFPGNMLGYGTVSVETRDQKDNDINYMPFIPREEDFAELLRNLKDLTRRSHLNAQPV